RHCPHLRSFPTRRSSDLHQLYHQHGLWVSTQQSVTMPGSEGAQSIASAMRRLREAPPEQIGECSVLKITDYAEGAALRPRWLPRDRKSTRLNSSHVKISY